MNLSSQIAYYRTRRPELAELLDVYERIFQIQEKAACRINPAIIVNLEEIRRTIEDGEFILLRHPIQADADILRQTMREIAAVFSPRFGSPSAFSTLLMHKEFRDPSLLMACLEDSGAESTKRLLFTKTSLSTGLSAETVESLVMNSLIPLYEAEARVLTQRVDYSLWQKGLCPFCGSPPQNSRLRRNDGKRILMCPLCRTEWAFPRWKCYSCGNDERGTLRYFYAGKDQVHRVDVCQKCKAYLKTVDESILRHHALLILENLITANLDSLAAREGYHLG